MKAISLYATETGERLRQVIRSHTPMFVYRRASDFLDGSSGAKLMGLKRYLEFRLKSGSTHGHSSDLEEVTLRNIQHPILFRPGTSDVGVIIHSCIRNAYRMYLPAGDVRLIVDAGANIGDTTVWYLNTFPLATVVAVEPDADNFRVLAKNCAPYGSRAIPINAALWPNDDEKLNVRPAITAAGISIDRANDSNGDCAGVSMLSILRMTGASEVDIFKCDIEGAEREVFSTHCAEWLQRTRQVAIEIHSADCERAVLAAMSQCAFDHFRYRDLNIFRRVN